MSQWCQPAMNVAAVDVERGVGGEMAVARVQLPRRPMAVGRQRPAGAAADAGVARRVVEMEEIAMMRTDALVAAVADRPRLAAVSADVQGTLRVASLAAQASDLDLRVLSWEIPCAIPIWEGSLVLMNFN